MRILIFLICFACSLSLGAQSTNPKYDQKLADSLGGDDYGMKQYILVMLKTGTKTADKAVRDSLFQGHMQNIGRLASEGKLVVAGPMKENSRGYRGLFILDVKTMEEARALLQTDPAVKAGLLDSELFSWYGSAALPMYLKFHEKVEKKTF